jgi:hypothetical protein
MRLSDFVPNDAPITVDAKLMERNAKAASATMDWKRTKILSTDNPVGVDPFRETSRKIARNYLHDALDELIDSESDAKPESDSEEEPAEESGQRAQGGVCGKGIGDGRTFACDHGSLNGVRAYENTQRKLRARVL